MAGCTNVGADAQIDTLFPAEILGDLVDKVKGKAVSDAGAIDGGALSAMLMRAMGDESPQVRAAAVAVGEWADASALVPMLQKYLDTDGNGETDTDRADRTAASIARTLGKIAGKQGDADKATDTVNRLASLLACPTDDVQTAAAEGIASAVRVLPGDRGKEILDHYLADIGGANARASGYGLAAAVKGMRSKSLLGHGVLESLVVALADKKNQEKRAGACVATECLMRVLVHIFEPYAAKIMPAIIKATGDKVTEVRSAADAALSAIVRLCSPHALAVYIPIMATVLCDRSSTWQSKVACLQKFQAQSELSGKQVGQLMDVMVPAVIESLTDTKPEVQSAAQKALSAMAYATIHSPEMKAMVPHLIEAICNSAEKTVPCIELLMDVTFMNPIDRPCLAVMVPVLSRALKERRIEHKKRASMVVGNMCGLVLNGKDLVPYVPVLMPELAACVRDSNPEMRQYGATALAALLKGMASSHLSTQFDRLLEKLDQLQTDMVSEKEEVRQAAERGLQEVIVMATAEATKTNQSEEEIQADMERLRIEEEKHKEEERKKAEAEANKDATKKAQQEAEAPKAGKGLCEKACRECPQCQLALEEMAAVAAAEKKKQDSDAKKAAKLQAEEEKKKAFEKFQAQQKAIMAKHKAGKKKK